MSKVIDGDCLLVMPTLDAESFDAIVTDPPYHLTTGKKGGSGATSLNVNSPAGRSRVGTGFMGKAWDGGDVAFRPETWEAALRVAKPGAHLVAFGGTRTFHRLTCAIEDAGWEIRDCLSWLYGSGFPKSHNGEWGGTALKPGWEPIILARKALTSTVAANFAEHGTGALNIDGCRIDTNGEELREGSGGIPCRNGEASRTRRYSERGGTSFAATPGPRGGDEKGRWPANVCLDESAAVLLDEQSGELSSGIATKDYSGTLETSVALGAKRRNLSPAATIGDSGGASRFFYTAKAPRSERNAGLDGMPECEAGTTRRGSGSMAREEERGRKPRDVRAANHHPTVKPLALMQWLCRLVTPKGGLILDPFTGSGSTGRAAIAEGFGFVGIELSPEYAGIARARIAEYAPLFNGAA